MIPRQQKENTTAVFISGRAKTLAPSQQAVLQLLVLTQEQERKHLIKLVHGVSLEDVQKPGCGVPPKEGKSIFHRLQVLSELFSFVFSLQSFLSPVSCFQCRQSQASRLKKRLCEKAATNSCRPAHTQ